MLLEEELEQPESPGSEDKDEKDVVFRPPKISRVSADEPNSDKRQLRETRARKNVEVSSVPKNSVSKAKKKPSSASKLQEGKSLKENPLFNWFFS